MKIDTTSQIQGTRTLLKFCRDHGYSVRAIADIENCLVALQREDIINAMAAYRAVPLGGMGCFNDWIPPVKVAGETAEYVFDLFDILVSHWSSSMKRLGENEPLVPPCRTSE